MQAFDEIHSAWSATDGFLALSESNAASARVRTHWADLRQINDQAYFVMLFAELETFIGEECEKLVARKRQARHWQDRRLWDATEVDRLAFMRRVALLTELGQTLYNQIDAYYRIRCQIAHGDVASVGPIALPVVIRGLRHIAGQL